MKFQKSRLMASAAVPVVLTAGLALSGIVAPANSGLAIAPTSQFQGPLPTAKSRSNAVQLAACNPCGAKNPCAAKNPCNPCAAKNPCSPCAAKNPCNPCAGANPCNPCGAAATTASTRCFVPRLQTASANPCAAKNPCGPCAAKNPCNPCGAANPCAAKNPCNPCAAKNPCNPCGAANPCAAKNPCNPCGAANPCNPCGAAAAVELTAAEAKAVYYCLADEMTAAYAKSGIDSVAGYAKWANVAATPYPSTTHGNRFVNNFVNRSGADRYARFEEGVPMPTGTVIAKDSFVVNGNGSVSVGPLFVMEKVAANFNAASGDWRYTMIMPNGTVAGVTKGSGAATVEFCNECHAAVADDQDYLFFLPDEFRVKG